MAPYDGPQEASRVLPPCCVLGFGAVSEAGAGCVDLEPGLCCRGSQGSKLLQPTVLVPTCRRPVLTFG